MKIKVNVKTEATISKEEIGHAIFQFIVQNYFEPDFDDGGCDWVTNEDCTEVYLGGGGDVCISSKPLVAKMVDIANYLIYDAVITI